MTLNGIVDIIILVGSVASAIYGVVRLIAPLTKKGTERKQKKILKKRAEEISLIKDILNKKEADCQSIQSQTLEKVNSLTEINQKIQENQQNTFLRVGSLEKMIDENEIDRIRWEILAFARACHKNNISSDEDYQHIFALFSKYNNLIKKTGNENCVMEVEQQFIREQYLNNKEERKV